MNRRRLTRTTSQSAVTKTHRASRNTIQAATRPATIVSAAFHGDDARFSRTHCRGVRSWAGGSGSGGASGSASTPPIGSVVISVPPAAAGG